MGATASHYTLSWIFNACIHLYKLHSYFVPGLQRNIGDKCEQNHLRNVVDDLIVVVTEVVTFRLGVYQVTR